MVLTFFRRKEMQIKTPDGMVNVASPGVANAGLTTGIITASKTGSASGKEQTAIEKLGKAFETRGSEIKAMDDATFKEFLKTDLEIKDDTLIKSLTENRDEVQKLAQQIAENSKASYELNK
jgi:hypothetical protein